MTVLDDYLRHRWPGDTPERQRRRSFETEAIRGLAGDDAIIEQMARAMYEHNEYADIVAWRVIEHEALGKHYLDGVRAALRVLGEPR